MTGFYVNRKTLRLRAKLGSDAYWIPPRMWAYAAEHQPDGDLSSYTSEELAELLGCSKHCLIMLQALKDSGFVDESGMIHDWNEHNGYHQKFSERAKKAAAARWSKSNTPPTGKGNRKVEMESGDKHCLMDATSITAEQIYNEYPKKVGKPLALRSISKAIVKVGAEKLMELTKAYAMRRSGDKSFIPYPATWFNQERYNDDPSTWTNYETGSKPNPRNNGCAGDHAEISRKTAEFVARQQPKQTLEQSL